MSVSLRRTPLFEQHVAAGARLVDFAGWEMPLQYEDAGIRAEHMAVREGCGVFDVSHMGQIETTGADSLVLLQRLLSGDVAAIAPGEDPAEHAGGAQYGVLCREDGGMLDDLITYRLGAERYLTVTNAANHTEDFAWFAGHAAAAPGAMVRDRIEDFAMLAVQGPRARELVQALAQSPLPARMRIAALSVAGVEVLAGGTGYTGEDGVELLCAPQDAARLWQQLTARGARPAGLGARDTLRLEACLPLYGNELSTDHNPIEAGLGWCCSEDTGFIGAEAVRAARAGGPAERLVAFVVEGPGIARQGNRIAGGGQVTSGTFSPVLGAGIGMAYVPAERAAPGTLLEIDVRGKMRRAVIAKKPLYRRGA